ncbi:acetoacetate decarboxylase family protein [Flectobacillus major]|jgi:hypothetical protein|uniref:acetoacetate decarboxylase family protein n=1 Tax=Flectobacillus major TaxID=103 RepID=UPI0003F739FF|nr:acetoacetate decarboxylase family protein [Flectobacillus major]
MENIPLLPLEKPAPWHLTGEAFVWVYKFPKDFVLSNGFLEDYQQQRFIGYWGTIMLVNYHSSNVGPYQELLFCPGLFTFNWSKMLSISKIFVSTQASVDNGRANWGIPKELAQFEWQKIGHKHHIKVMSNNQMVFSCEAQHGSMSIPISTSYLSLTIAQKKEQDLLITQPTATGKASFAKTLSRHTNATLFPDVTPYSSWLSIYIHDLSMVFHPSAVKPNFFPL